MTFFILKKIINLTKQAINEIEKGRSKISLENACILAKFYGVSLEYIVGSSDNKNFNDDIADFLSREEELIIKNFRLLDDISKGKLIERSRILLEESPSSSIEKKKA